MDRPYVDVQAGENGIDRNVWMFPIRPVPDNNVKKPSVFVFKDMDDYKQRGKNIDAEYMKMLAENSKKKSPTVKVTPSAAVKPIIVIPDDIVGKQVIHKVYGEGTIIDSTETVIIVSFDSVGEKKLVYDVCIKNKLIKFI